MKGVRPTTCFAALEKCSSGYTETLACGADQVEFDDRESPHPRTWLGFA